MDAKIKNKWSSFANEHAMVTAPMLALGGLISMIGQFKWWPIGIYSFIVAIVVLALEYPRSGKPGKRPSNLPRKNQEYLSGPLSKLGIIYTDYVPRSVLYFLLSFPALLTLSTILPAINLLIVSCLYLTSKMRKEQWILIEKPNPAEKQSSKVINPPDRPPPRDFSELQQAPSNHEHIELEVGGSGGQTGSQGQTAGNNINQQ